MKVPLGSDLQPPLVGRAGSFSDAQYDVLRFVPDHTLPKTAAVCEQPDRPIVKFTTHPYTQEHIVILAGIRREAECDVTTGMAEPCSPAFRVSPGSAGPYILSQKEALLVEQVEREVAAPQFNDAG